MVYYNNRCNDIQYLVVVFIMQDIVPYITWLKYIIIKNVKTSNNLTRYMIGEDVMALNNWLCFIEIKDVMTFFTWM